MKLKGVTGALVGDVTPNSPAAETGIKTGDVITSVNGKKIGNARELRLMIGLMAPGTKVHLEVRRNEESKTFDVALAEMPAMQPSAAASPEEPAAPEKSTVFGGVGVAEITDEVRSTLNLPNEVEGAVIVQIDPTSAAAQAGLREGDVIEEVNKQPVKSAKDLVALTHKLKSNEKVLLRVWSQGRRGYVALGPQP